MMDEAREKVTFDVFLSHNRKDKPAVRELATAVRKRGIKVWLDEDELRPGIPWQKLLEAAIKASKAGAVLVGKDGVGPWEDLEMRALLSRAVKQGIPVIPVLLPGAGTEPELPLFLEEVTYVDLRAGLTEDGLDRLVWGVTGRRPNPQSEIRNPQSPPLDRPPRAQAGKLFGRDAQLDDLLGRLRRRESACVWGLAGFGKTALAAEAIYCLLAEVDEDLARSPFPGGIVLLDLYRLSEHGKRPWDQLAEQAWHTLADRFDPAQPADRPGRDRAERACAGRQALVVIEGAEEAKDCESLTDLLSVLDGAATQLVLTRNKGQCTLHDSIQVDVELETPDALALLRKLTKGRVPEDVLAGVLQVLGGHPLALTWAGCQLKLAEEPPTLFLRELTDRKLPGLRDPKYEKHTLKWLYDRSVRKLSDDARRVLTAAGLLAAAPFDIGAAVAALRDTDEPEDQESGPRAGEALKQLVRHALLRVLANEERWEFTHALAARFAGSEAMADASLLRALCRWVLDTFEDGASHLRRTGDFSRLQGALLHAAALLARDETGEVAGRLANWLLYDGYDLLFSLVRLGYMRDSLNAIEGWMRRQPETKRGTPGWRREYATLLQRVGDVLTGQGKLVAAREAYLEYRAVCAQLATESPNNDDYQRNLSVSLNKLGDVQLTQGDLGGARASYEQSRTIFEKLAAGDRTNAQWQRDLSMSLIKLGDVQLAQGDLAGARAGYEHSRTIAEKLAAGDPTNAGWQRDLSVSLERLGDVQLAQGDLAGARDSYEQSGTIREKLAAGDPTNAEWQRDLSVSLEKLGDVQLTQGDLARARASYQQSRTTRAKLAAGDPTNAQWQRDLSVSLNKLGDVQLRLGDLATARASYEQSRKTREKLAAGDPTNAGWQRDLSVSLEKLGNVQLAQGDLAGARDSYEQSRTMRDKLAAGDPTNAKWQRDLSVSLNKLGDVQLAQGDLAGARASYEKSRTIAEKLAAGDPTNAGWQRDLFISRSKVADILVSQGDLQAAVGAYRGVLQVNQKLAAGDPTNAQWQRDLSLSLMRLGDVAARSGDPATARRQFTAALAISERLTKLDPTNATWRNDAAWLRDQLDQLPPM